MVAGAFDDGRCTGVADREALAGAAGREELATGSAVEHGVAEQDCVAGVIRRREHDDAPAAHALAHVVVALADHFQIDARREERTEALTG